MSTPYLLAIDQGTTRTKAMIFDPEVHIVAEDYQELTPIYPRPGWVEQDPNEIWRITLRALENVLRRGKIEPAQIAAIGIANQGETVMAWDKSSGQPLYNAIVWQCRRTTEYCERLAQDRPFAELIRSRTGLLLDPYFSATKIRWLLDHIPDVQRKAENDVLQFGTIDTWLVWKLTGQRWCVTDYSTASRTMLFNIHTLDWDGDILQRLNIKRGFLPSVRDSSGCVGYTDPQIFFGESVPIAGLLCDQQGALFGQGCIDVAQAKCTYGTGAFLLMNTGAVPVPSQHGLLTSIAWRLNNEVRYFLDGGVYSAGAAVDWLRDGLGIIRDVGEAASLALSVTDTGGVYCVPAFSGLGAPYWDSSARGTIVGLTRGTTKAHLVRAVLEGIAYRVREVLEAMQGDAQVHISSLRVDGGLTKNEFLLQFQSDILGIPVEIPTIRETTALGVAAMAGLAVGFWKDVGDIRGKTTIERSYEPQMASSQREELYHGWKKAITVARGM